MKLNQINDVEQKDVDMPGAEGCKVRQLIGKNENAPTFAMRQFEVAPGGFTPRHSHPYEHEIYVLEGTGTVLEDNRLHQIKQGDVIFVAPDEIHQFKCSGDTPLKFLCLIPNSAINKPITLAMDKPITLAPECGVD